MRENQDSNNPSDQEREVNLALAAEAPAWEAEELRQVWALAGSVELEDAPDAEDVARVREQLLRRARGAVLGGPTGPTGPTGDTARTGERPASRRPPDWRAWLVAASLVVVALSSYLVLRPRVYVAPPGMATELTLGDGTRVELVAGSRLMASSRLGPERSVRLDGEAFFSVEPAATVFIVATGEASISVLGTEFAVRAWPTEGRTDVHLLEGRVRVAGAEAKREMVPGESVSVTAAGMNDAPSYGDAVVASWRKGDLLFIDAPLGNVLDDIGRRFGTPVSRAAGIDEDRLVNGRFMDPEDPSRVLGDLTASLGLGYRITSDGYHVFRP